MNTPNEHLVLSMKLKALLINAVEAYNGNFVVLFRPINLILNEGYPLFDCDAVQHGSIKIGDQVDILSSLNCFTFEIENESIMNRITSNLFEDCIVAGFFELEGYFKKTKIPIKNAHFCAIASGGQFNEKRSSKPEEKELGKSILMNRANKIVLFHTDGLMVIPNSER